jgi:hypothetical protein
MKTPFFALKTTSKKINVFGRFAVPSSSALKTTFITDKCI